MSCNNWQGPLAAMKQCPRNVWYIWKMKLKNKRKAIEMYRLMHLSCANKEIYLPYLKKNV